MLNFKYFIQILNLSISLTSYFPPFQNGDFIISILDAYVFRRVERSLFAQGHVKMISFFPVREIPLRFISLNLFLGTYCSDLSVFCMNTTTGSDLSYSEISAAEIFFGELLAKKKSIFGFFLECNGYIFESGIQVSFKMLTFLH